MTGKIYYSHSGYMGASSPPPPRRCSGVRTRNGSWNGRSAGCSRKRAWATGFSPSSRSTWAGAPAQGAAAQGAGRQRIGGITAPWLKREFTPQGNGRPRSPASTSRQGPVESPSTAGVRGIFPGACSSRGRDAAPGPDRKAHKCRRRREHRRRRPHVPGESVKYGIAKALQIENPELRTQLKRAGS